MNLITVEQYAAELLEMIDRIKQARRAAVQAEENLKRVRSANEKLEQNLTKSLADISKQATDYLKKLNGNRKKVNRREAVKRVIDALKSSKKEVTSRELAGRCEISYYMATTVLRSLVDDKTVPVVRTENPVRYTWQEQ